ncbi:MAG: hypothetical protein LBH57_04430 [Treponema sp.]|jgi:hypothetical protein|nr:hypothetical protein [Treponema sp.]
MSRQIKITIDEEMYAALCSRARELGFMGVAPIIRQSVLQAFGSPDTGFKRISVPVAAYLEFEKYAEAKRLGSVDVFAGFAMQQYMGRFPAKTPPKSQDGKTTGE